MGRSGLSPWRPQAWEAEITLTPQSQATALMTAPLGKSDQTGAKPLSAQEWTRLAVWLREHDLEPSALLEGNVRSLLSDWADGKVSVERIQSLLDRGVALGLALERWQRAGIWILTRSDPEFPERLKRRLRSDSPPILFGCGNRSLLNSPGLAVVGSRNVSNEDLADTAHMGKQTAMQGLSVVSGGARGVDRTAMMGALEGEGKAVGILVDGLIRSAGSTHYRRFVMSGQLALVTPFNPEGGFSVGKAMARNRMIYCMADAAVVIHSAAKSGGTWSGATENLRNDWVPLWVKPDTAGNSGNSRLVELGARWLPDSLAKLSDLFAVPTAMPESISVPSHPHQNSQSEGTEAPMAGNARTASKTAATRTVAAPAASQPGLITFYELFLRHLATILEAGPAGPEEIRSRMELNKAQATDWLKKAVDDGECEKLMRPVRYRSAQNISHQKDLFCNSRKV